MAHLKAYPDSQYLRNLAEEAGSIMTDYFGADIESEWKEDNTPLTIADKEINDLVLERISKDFPHINIIAEEGNCEVKEAEYSILCDPIDGTIAFARDLPLSTFVISVVKIGNRKDNGPLVSVVYDPFLGRMWHATKGEGSYLDNKRLTVSKHNSILQSHVALEMWRECNYNMSPVREDIMNAGSKIVTACSIAIFGGLIAQGKFDASVFPAHNGYETAAMQLLVEEAGGKATDFYGNPIFYGPEGAIQGHILSNGIIHNELVRMVGRHQYWHHESKH